MTSTTGAVGAGSEATASAAAEILAAGGNAFDAVVAAGLASAVAEPMLTSLGGGGFLLGRSATGEATVHDFFVDTPGRGAARTAETDPDFVPVTIEFGASDQEFHVGLGSVAVPGALSGYLEIVATQGRLSFSDVCGPAHRLAREGVTLDTSQAYLVDLLWPIVARTEAGRRLYGDAAGQPPAPGHRFTNPLLADFLDELAAAPPDRRREGLALGGRGAQLVHDMEGVGLLTMTDLASYKVAVRPPLTLPFRDRTIFTNPEPSFGGALMGLGLQLLEEAGPATGAIGGSERFRALTAAMRAVDHHRTEGLVDGRLRVSRGTTHVSVADADGNVAAMTTSNGENSGYLAPGTGVMLNNMLGEDDLHPDGFHGAPPGERVSSMMAPTIVLDPDGEVELVVGSGGSKRIRTALMQVVSAVVDHGATPAEAIDHPRVHWDGETLQVEPGLPDATVAALGAERPVNLWPERNVYFGGAHAVGRVGDRWSAGGDPRRGGATRQP